VSELPSRVTDAGLHWLDASGEHADIVLSTRMRLARNLQGFAFGPRSRVNDRTAVLRRIRSAVESVQPLKGASVEELRAIPSHGARLLLERRVISRELLGDISPEAQAGGVTSVEAAMPGAMSSDAPVLAAEGAAVVLPPASPLSVMVNEEDHLRLQVLVSGLDLHEAWNRIDMLDEELGQHIPYAFHPEFGFLTSCPTNVGTGLRASVLLHLPGLVLTKEIGKVLQGLSQVGLTFRGLFGEGSEVVGNFFQISNQTTLGKTEEDLVDQLDAMVRQVIQVELQARHRLLSHAGAVTEDKVWRGYGLLRYARTLSFVELMNLLSGVRLGVSLKLLPGLRVYALNRIMMFTQPAHLEEAAGRSLSPAERDAHRAAYVRRILLDEGRVEEESGPASGSDPSLPPEEPAS
jgi:protein arginine kinase